MSIRHLTDADLARISDDVRAAQIPGNVGVEFEADDVEALIAEVRERRDSPAAIEIRCTAIIEAAKRWRKRGVSARLTPEDLVLIGVIDAMTK